MRHGILRFIHTVYGINRVFTRDILGTFVGVSASFMQGYFVSLLCIPSLLSYSMRDPHVCVVLIIVCSRLPFVIPVRTLFAIIKSSGAP